MAKVFIATPAYSGDVCWEYCVSLLNATEDLRLFGHAARVEVHPGCCYIQLARIVLVHKFLESDCTDLLFIDADLRFQPDAIRRVVESAGDIVGGLYPFKIDTGGFPVRPFTAPQLRYANGLVEADGLPTGFMRVKRHVIEGMVEKYPERRLEQRQQDGSVKVMYDLFPCGQIGVDWMGEDYQFSRLAKQAGYRCWIYPDLEFSHIGRKAWSGSYAAVVGDHRA